MGVASGNPTWQNSPSTASPLSAAALNKMETALDTIKTKVDGLPTTVNISESALQALLLDTNSSFRRELLNIIDGSKPENNPVGVGYVGSLASASPYSTLSVEGIDDQYDMIGYDITAAGGGRRVTTRFQGPFIAGTPAVDALQRIEEITLGDGLALGPRSNLEIALQVFENTSATTDAQFFPYHGSTSAHATQVRAATYRTRSGATVPMPAIGQTVNLPDGLVINQLLRGKHPDAAANQLELNLTTTFHPDGMIEVQGKLTFLVATKVGAVYAPMVPYDQDLITRLEHSGGVIALDPTPPGVTTNVTIPLTVDSGVFQSNKRSDIAIAWAWTNPTETLRLDKADRKTDGTISFVQRRTDGMNKLYRLVWDTNTVVSAGTVWNFGGQYRYVEVA